MRNEVSDGSESGYMYRDREWISYDTLHNTQKRAAYVVGNNLGGLFVWSRTYRRLDQEGVCSASVRSNLVDMDDFNGVFCNNGTYPFIKNSLSLLPTNMASYI